MGVEMSPGQSSRADALHPPSFQKVEVRKCNWTSSQLMSHGDKEEEINIIHT